MKIAIHFLIASSFIRLCVFVKHEYKQLLLWHARYRSLNVVYVWCYKHCVCREREREREREIE